MDIKINTKISTKIKALIPLGSNSTPSPTIPDGVFIDPETDAYFTDPETGDYIGDPEV